MILPVEFAEKADGLWLSYDNYRNLEKNIIAMRTYIKQLEVLVGYYQGQGAVK